MPNRLTCQLPISTNYRQAIFDALVLQVVLGILSLMILDGGQIAQICGIAMLGFWGGVTTLICRRPHTPTPTDITLIRFAFLPLLLASFFLVSFIWRLRGF